jgi:hypothetical protein
MAARKKSTAAAPKTAAPAATFGPEQERALAEIEQLYAHGAAWDTETTGLGEQAEIWEVAVYDILDGGLLFESFVQPMAPLDQWEPEAFVMAGGIGNPRYYKLPTQWSCPVCRYEVWVPPNPNANWHGARLREAREHFAVHVREWPDWRQVEPDFNAAVGGNTLVCWAGLRDDLYDKRLLQQTRAAACLPEPGVLRNYENLKFLHMTYRRDRYKATTFPKGLTGGLERAALVEGLKWGGAIHRARGDAEMVAKVIRACVQTDEAQEVAQATADLLLTRRLRMSGQACRDDLVVSDGAQVPRWQADVALYSRLADAAAKRGQAQLAGIYEEFAQESRTGCYAPTAVPPPSQMAYAAPVAIAPWAVGDIVRMAQKVVWRYGQLGEIVEVRGLAPIQTFRVRFADGETLTYREDCLAERIEPGQAKLEGWK